MERIKGVERDGKIAVGGVFDRETADQVLKSRTLVNATHGFSEADLEALNQEIEQHNKIMAESEEEPMTPTQRPRPQVKTPPVKPQPKVEPKPEVKVMEDPFAALDRDIDSIAAKAKQEEAEPEVTQEEDFKNKILAALKSVPGAPNDAAIQQLKAQYGENGVFCLGVNDNEAYVFTFLRRAQWKKIQETLQQLKQVKDTDGEDELKQKVVQACVLFPKPLPTEFFYNSRAGLIDSLFESIMAQSYFLSPQQVAFLTVAL